MVDALFFSSIIRQFVWEFLTTKSVVPSCELTYPIISPFTNIFESMIFRLSPGGIWTRFFGGYLHFWCYNPYIWLGGGFKDFLFSPLFGEDSHFDSYFSKGLKPPTRYIWGLNVQSLQFSCFFWVQRCWFENNCQVCTPVDSGSRFAELLKTGKRDDSKWVCCGRLEVDFFC